MLYLGIGLANCHIVVLGLILMSTNENETKQPVENYISVKAGKNASLLLLREGVSRHVKNYYMDHVMV